MKAIPKTCYLFWDGYPMSFLNTFTPITFHKQNPDWKIVVYLSRQKWHQLGKDIYTPAYTGRDYFYQLSHLFYIEFREIDLRKIGVNVNVPACSGSDMFRRWVLYEYGGVYSDFDCIWLRPMEHISKIECLGDPDDFEAIVSFYKYQEGHHNVSNLISEKGSPFMKSLIDREKTIKPPYGHQSYGSTMLNKMYPTYQSVIEKYPRVLGLKYETFYPYSIYNMKQLWKENDLKPIEDPDVLCVHWFNGHGLSKEYINNDGHERKCSMTTILKQQFPENEFL